GEYRVGEKASTYDMCLDYLIEHKPNENYDDRDRERFVKYRMGTKGQKRSAINKANIAVQKIYHTHGSKPFNITQEEK
ncbi:hypothetical protein LINPERHAP2_LOCUS16376, partial [Linum perenne]